MAQLIKTRTLEQIRSHSQKYFKKLEKWGQIEELECRAKHIIGSEKLDNGKVPTCKEPTKKETSAREKKKKKKTKKKRKEQVSVKLVDSSSKTSLLEDKGEIAMSPVDTEEKSDAPPDSSRGSISPGGVGTAEQVSLEDNQDDASTSSSLEMSLAEELMAVLSEQEKAEAVKIQDEIDEDKERQDDTHEGKVTGDSCCKDSARDYKEDAEKELSKVLWKMERGAEQFIRLVTSTKLNAATNYDHIHQKAQIQQTILQDPGEQWRGVDSSCQSMQVTEEEFKGRPYSKTYEHKLNHSITYPSPTSSNSLHAKEHETGYRICTSNHDVEMTTQPVQHKSCHFHTQSISGMPGSFASESLCFSASALDTAVEQHLQATSNSTEISDYGRART